MVFASHDLIAENGTILCEGFAQSGEVLCSEIDVNRMALERKRVTTFDQEHRECRVVQFAMPLKDAVLTRRIEDSVRPDGRRETRGSVRVDSASATTWVGETVGSRPRKFGRHRVVRGLDSTLALLVCVGGFDDLHLDRKGIVAVTMPGFGTTKRTKSNASRLAEALGVTLLEVDITKAVRQHFSDIGQDEGVEDVTYENSQARERTQILMDIANKRGGLVIGTGDLSELALGWATYNGDHMSMYGVNCSVPKTLVRFLVRHAAMRMDGSAKAVLLDIIDTPVSPELLPAKEDGTISQVTEDIVGPYELHDFSCIIWCAGALPRRKSIVSRAMRSTESIPMR